MAVVVADDERLSFSPEKKSSPRHPEEGQEKIEGVCQVLFHCKGCLVCSCTYHHCKNLEYLITP